jgi:hypothetical protein
VPSWLGLGARVASLPAAEFRALQLPRSRMQDRRRCLQFCRVDAKSIITAFLSVAGANVVSNRKAGSGISPAIVRSSKTAVCKER